MFTTVPITLIRPVTGQTTIGSDNIFSFLPKGRKLFLNGYKVDKTVSRLRRG
jgi:hypothetical protein